jgi:phenylacetate-CoA ligase
MALSRENYLARPELAKLQRDRLRALLAETLPRNEFYAQKFAAAGASADEIDSPADLARLPFTTKAELTADQEVYPPYGLILTYPPDHYCRLHQTSGTTGRPLRWLDTPESWNAILGCWETILRMAGLKRGDRLFFPFSFGPFLAFWPAFEAAGRMGLLCLPGGGMSSVARLHFLLENEATAVLCTPTYALRLAEVAAQAGIDLRAGHVRRLLVAGEPGAGIAATRGRIEAAWGARVFDHYGLTEVGPVGMECRENPGGFHLLETECVAEVIDPATAEPVPAGQVGELVVTNLHRSGSPVIRYRTGDLVQVDPRPCPCGRSFLRLDGGVLGRGDDMIHVRGNNVYPSALEAVVRRFADVAEYRVHVDNNGPLTALRLEVEPVTAERGAALAEQLDRAIRDELFFRAEVTLAAPGSLPRFEMKAKRFTKKNRTTATQRHREEKNLRRD